MPTLQELGFETEGLKTAVWIGGETEALGMLTLLLILLINKIIHSSPRTSFRAQGMGC